MPRADSRTGRLVRALAAETRPVTVGTRPGVRSDTRFDRRLVQALGAAPPPVPTVPPQPRGPREAPRRKVGRLPAVLTGLGVAVTCVATIVTQGALTAPLPYEEPGARVAVEAWRPVPNGRLSTGAGTDGIVFSPDNGRLLLTLSAEGIGQWDVEHFEPVTARGHGVREGAPLGISPDGRTVAVADGRNVRGLRTDTGRPAWTISRTTGRVKAVSVGRSRATLAVSDEPLRTRLLDAVLGDDIRLTPRGDVPAGADAAQFSPDGKTLAVAGEDRAMHLWDVSSSLAPRRVSPSFSADGHRVTSLSFSPDGRLLAVVDASHAVRLWDVGNPRRPRPLGRPLGPDSPVTAVAFSRDRQLVATVGVDHVVCLWRRS